MQPAIMQCTNISHMYQLGEVREQVLFDVSTTFKAGETCVLMGPSGSGKTTLISILGCMLRPSQGSLHIGNEQVTWRSNRALTRMRRKQIGFVFQHAQLFPFLTIHENLLAVGSNSGIARHDLLNRIQYLLEQLDIAGCSKKQPYQLSGGQQQRVAIARAVLHRPAIILADEPTASLDWEHGEVAIKLLVDQARQNQSVLLAVTHDSRLLPYFDRQFGIEQGRLQEKST